MLHHTPEHVSSSTLLIIRRSNCITTASGIVTPSKQPYSTRVESGMFRCSRSVAHYTIPWPNWSTGQLFINNYKYALHVSDALCAHHQEHYKL